MFILQIVTWLSEKGLHFRYINYTIITLVFNINNNLVSLFYYINGMKIFLFRLYP